MYYDVVHILQYYLPNGSADLFLQIQFPTSADLIIAQVGVMLCSKSNIYCTLIFFSLLTWNISHQSPIQYPSLLRCCIIQVSRPAMQTHW